MISVVNLAVMIRLDRNISVMWPSSSLVNQWVAAVTRHAGMGGESLEMKETTPRPSSFCCMLTKVQCLNAFELFAAVNSSKLGTSEITEG